MLPAFEVAPIAVAAIFAGVMVLVVTARPVWRWLKWVWNRRLTAAVDPWSERPGEQGWTEELGRWGPYRFGRAFSVNDHLFKVAANARRVELERPGE